MGNAIIFFLSTPPTIHFLTLKAKIKNNKTKQTKQNRKIIPFLVREEVPLCA